jgi:hypothetical protein
MVKKLKFIPRIGGIAVLILGLARLAGGAEVPFNLDQSLESLRKLAHSDKSVKLLWSKQMNGAIYDFALAGSGNSVWIATSPDPDIPESSKHYLLTRYSSQGKLGWQLIQKSPIKEVAVSKDGQFGVVSNFENQLFALNGKGKQLWSVETMCKPMMSNINKKIICYHDDDNEPKTGFEVFDWKGNKIYSYPIAKDILALKLSADEKNLVVGLAQGEVVFFTPEFIPLWQKSVPGEIVDVAVSSGDPAFIAVLFREKSNPKLEKVAVLDRSGVLVKTISPTEVATQIEISPDGGFVFYYGNGTSGQVLGCLSVSASTEKWKHRSAAPAEYTSPLVLTATEVYEGFQEDTLIRRGLHVLRFNYEGHLLKDIALNPEQSAYLFTQRVAQDTSVVAVATDDGKITVYGKR